MSQKLYSTLLLQSSEDNVKLFAEVADEDIPTIHRFTRLLAIQNNVCSVSTILSRRGWKPSNKSKRKSIIELVEHTIVETSIPIPVIGRLLQIQLDCETSLRLEYGRIIRIPDKTNIKNEVLASLKLYVINDDIQWMGELFDALWCIETTYNGCIVGAGEICLSFLLGATKTTNGDLAVGGDVVEMKTSGGRLGSSHYPGELIRRVEQITGLTSEQIESEYLRDKTQRYTRFQFNHIVQAAIIDNKFQLSRDKVIDCIVACRNYQLTSEQEACIRDIIDSLLVGYTKPEICKLIIALHAVCYWYHHEFTILQLVNTDSYEARNILTPFTREIDGNSFKYIYNQIAEDIHTNLRVGYQNPVGVEVFLKS